MGLLKDFRYHAPSSVKEALVILKKSPAPFVLGGGTFSLNFLKKASRYPSDVVGLKKVPSLNGIKDSKKALVIGSMTTVAELASCEAIHRHFPSLAEACSRLATTPIRNMATMGGNIASRFFWVDLPCVLISLGAKVSYAMPGARTRTVAVSEFLNSKAPKKFILTQITLPKRKAVSYYFRHTKAMEVDVPSLALAFCASLDGGRLSDVAIVVNTASSFPIELKKTARALEGKFLLEVTIKDALGFLKEDIMKSKLDEHRVRLLVCDMEKLIKQLTGSVLSS